jgi:branched-chain amino acid transport system ATP-binding protein
MNVLEISDLTVRFGGLTAVNAVSLNIPAGEIVSVIGPNGAGKTTLFNAVTGVHEATAGTIRFDGRDIHLPFRWTTALALALVGFLAALSLVLMANAERLWDAVITNNYVYQQSFPWTKALGTAIRFFTDEPGQRLLVPSLIGAVIGLAGACAIWARARYAPEVVARAGTARTFQNIRLFNQMTVLDNVLLGMDSRLHTRFWHAALRLPLYWRERANAEQQAMEILQVRPARSRSPPTG